MENPFYLQSHEENLSLQVFLVHGLLILYQSICVFPTLCYNNSQHNSEKNAPAGAKNKESHYEQA